MTFDLWSILLAVFAATVQAFAIFYCIQVPAWKLLLKFASAGKRDKSAICFIVGFVLSVAVYIGTSEPLSITGRSFGAHDPVFTNVRLFFYAPMCCVAMWLYYLGNAGGGGKTPKKSGLFNPFGSIVRGWQDRVRITLPPVRTPVAQGA